MNKRQCHFNEGIAWVLFAAIAILLSLLLLYGCVTIKLERQLPSDIRAWYETHSILMDCPVPEDISPRGVTEKRYFLELPEKLQRRYIEMFWQIRHWDAEKVFKARLGYILRAYNRGINAAPARVLLLCGFPEEIWLVGPDGRTHSAGFPNDTRAYSQCTLIWRYWWRTGLVEYGWNYHGDGWTTAPLGVVCQSQQLQMENWWRWWFAPTLIGWDEWREALKQ